jgi:hypothetical protein
MIRCCSNESHSSSAELHVLPPAVRSAVQSALLLLLLLLLLFWTKREGLKSTLVLMLMLMPFSSA